MFKEREEKNGLKLPNKQLLCLFPVSSGYEDDKVQLPFTVTDLKGRNLQLVTEPHNGQVCVFRSSNWLQREPILACSYIGRFT